MQEIERNRYSEIAITKRYHQSYKQLRLMKLMTPWLSGKRRYGDEDRCPTWRTWCYCVHHLRTQG